MDKKDKSASAESQTGAAVGQPREAVAAPLGEEATLASAPARFRHTNDRSAIVDADQSRYFVWAGTAEDADALVEELNSKPDSAERFTWAGGDPTRPEAPAEQSAEV